jgi:hypothetical protein
MENPSPRFLANSLDTVQCAYYLAPSGERQIDFTHLKLQREKLRDAKFREPMPISLGSMEFMLAPYGSASGYPFVLLNRDFRIEFGEFNNPSFFVTFPSEALWRVPVEELHGKFLGWAASVGFHPFKHEVLSRVDFCFDYFLPNLDFNEDAFVSKSSKDSQHREGGQVQTFTFGKGEIVLRVYDKIAEIAQQSDKTWLFGIWGVDHNVWRVEWQVRKSILRRFDIRTFTDLHDQCGDALRYLVCEHDTLRMPTMDSNRSRWPLHPLWIDLQARIQQLNFIGIYRAVDQEAILRERLMRIAISVYGYLKRIGAVTAIQQSRSSITDDEAIRQLVALLKKVHDPLTWRIDVSKRIKAIQLGQW